MNSLTYNAESMINPVRKTGNLVPYSRKTVIETRNLGGGLKLET